MKIIDITYRTNDINSINFDQVPPALLNAIMDTKRNNPDLIADIDNKDYPMDRLFEKLYKCRLEYNDFNGIKRIIWPDERDYIMFLLKWS